MMHALSYREIGNRVQLVGDDLFVTNPEKRLRKDRAARSKPAGQGEDQIGS